MMATTEDLSAVDTLGVVRRWTEGCDKDGLPVLVIVPLHLGGADREQAFRLFERQVLALDGGYRIVLVASGHAIGLDLSLWAARRSRSLPLAVRKNLAAVTVVHPTIFVRSSAWILSLFMSSKVWDKVQMADRIEELVLDGVFEEDDLGSLLPASCRQFERELEVDADDRREQARREGFVVSPEE